MGLLDRLFGRKPPSPDGEHVHTANPEVDAPGWHAIDRVLEPVYGTQEPKHYGTIHRFRLGGPDPLDGLSIYVNDGPPAHWHYVSYGLSELYGKESDDASTSGWGIELTFRLARPASAGDPPVWPLNLMQNLARYVFESGRVLLPGHHMDSNGPIALDERTNLTAMLFALDPQLGEIHTPNGHLRFVQIVGATADELAAVKAWDTQAFLAAFRESNPLLVTDLGRSSLLEDAAFAAQVARRTADEGTSMSMIYVDTLRWAVEGADPEVVRLTVGALAVPSTRTLLAGRLGRGEAAWIQGPDRMVSLQPGEGWSVVVEDASMELELPGDAATSLAAVLEPRVGSYTVPELPTLVIEVEETIVRDKDGNELRRVG